MPVPKKARKAYGVIVGKNINEGKSPEEAKGIADRAVRHKSAVTSIARMLRRNKK